jgi:acyl-CoA thioesterase YciA
MDLINKENYGTKDMGLPLNLFGGNLLAWVDEAATAYATEYCHTPNMVTLNEMMFNESVKAG